MFNNEYKNQNVEGEQDFCEEVGNIMDKQIHVLVVTYPAQGHVGPLMKLSNLIADRGIKVTVVTAESIHARVLSVFSSKQGEFNSHIRIVSIPDGSDQLKDKKDRNEFIKGMWRVMPGQLEELIRKMNSSEEEKISCVIADAIVGWAFEIAEKMGVKSAMFWPSTLESISLSLQIPKLIEDGILDHDGTPLTTKMIQVSPKLPAISTLELPWICPGQPVRQKLLFGFFLAATKAIEVTNWILSNSFYDLHPSACDLIPKLMPVGPLLSSNALGNLAGSLWHVDSTCLSWLDEQQAKSVIYVAFGSIAILSQCQFEELALGLELLGHPFLWVIRSDLVGESIIKYPDGFLDRTANQGKIVEWAPQEKVLCHPSVACFLSHCGWNSTMEGISNGVPFMCWPYFSDQFHIRSYIGDFWKVGLGLTPGENGIISRYEIKQKMERLLCDSEIEARALKLKDIARRSLGEGGSSSKNLNTFIKQLKC